MGEKHGKIMELNQRKMAQPDKQPTDLEELIAIHLRFETAVINNLTTGGHQINMDKLGEIVDSIMNTMVDQYHHGLGIQNQILSI